MEIEYIWKEKGLYVTDTDMEAYAELYSMHYGVWGSGAGGRYGQRVRLSSSRIKDWLQSDNSKVAEARHGGVLIGYAIAVMTKLPKPRYGTVSWVTQLVVHEDYRHKGVGKTLLYSIWGISDHWAWGILSSNPYAIRALEKATRRRCVPVRIRKNKTKLNSIGVTHVPYVTEETELEVSMDVSRINTKFYVDHSDVSSMISDVSSKEIPWKLGQINEGWEWFAFTFKDQEQIKLTSIEIISMIKAADQVTRQAYSRMQISKKDHPWSKHTATEVEFIIRECKLVAGDIVLDLGCGIGRHSIELSKKRMEVTGVDYVKESIQYATREGKICGCDNVSFIEGDCRKIDFNKKYDAILCIYDVVGTFVDKDDNLEILKSIAKHLKEDGYALISVMNHERTESKAKHRFSFAEDPNKLLEIAPSQTMELTGDVFDPDHYMIDTDTSIVYRREQFTYGDSLPVELVVRDKRYTEQEIRALCIDAGLHVIWSRFVNAGKWEEHVPSDEAKEVLLLCKV